MTSEKPRTRLQLGAASALVLCLLASPFAAAPASASPAAPTATVTIEVPAIEDAGTIPAVPAFNGGGQPYFVLNSRPNGDFDYNFVKFDLNAVPAGATIDSAQLRMRINAAANPLPIEMGRADGAWDESTITWNTQPAVTWAGNVQTATVIGDLNWPIKTLLDAWLSGAQANNGVALRGKVPGTGGVRADTKDGLVAPVLVITYTVADDNQPRPDLGDAPDSSNNLGVNNFAYPDGTLGRFPTVFQVTPAGQPIGPRHSNATPGGYLGDHISGEVEADGGPDQDGVNNILSGGPAFSNMDRGDDGWRNRNAAFTNCARTTLTVRVRRHPAATINAMYLNVWFDGDHDGDWNDNAFCQPSDGGAPRASTEWIVRDRVIPVGAIAPGGFVNLNVNTEVVLNTSPEKLHWMRFTLSDSPAIVAGLPDGRGPAGGYAKGETEDYLQRNGGPGENGTLSLVKQVITESTPVEWLDTVTYTIRLRHIGGTQPIEARIQDVLPYPLIVYPTLSSGQIEYVDVSSNTGGAAPLAAQLEVMPPDGITPPQQVIKWSGTLAPDAEIKLTFLVRVLTLCQPNQQTQTIQNIAQAQPRGGAVVSDSVSFVAKCLGYDENAIIIDQTPNDNLNDIIDVLDLPGASWQGVLTNTHAHTVTLGFYQQAAGATQAQSANARPAVISQITLGPGQRANVTVPLHANAGASEALAQPVDANAGSGLGFCFLPLEAEVCPDAQQYPNLHGVIPFIATIRPNDLGDAPDSTNHAGAAMAAYPGVPASFPTVFDPATGAVQGPRHAFPGPLHLGKRVSREAEADLGPDQDALNNIRPAANDPDNDRGDDGTNLALWNLNNCQATNIPVRIAISPLAVAYFQQQVAPAYLNVWADGNRNGSWADAANCGGTAAPEHMVIDRQINVVALGAGLHTIMVPTGLVPWANNNAPAWVRITLSERPSNKTLTAPGPVAHGDGRGYVTPFRSGETEDYLYYPNADGGPDIDVQLAAKADKGSTPASGLMSANAAELSLNFDQMVFAIDIANNGSRDARNVRVTFTKPAQLRDMEIILAKGTDVAMEELTLTGDKVTFNIPRLFPGESGTVVLGWYGCITCTLAASSAANAMAGAAVDYTGTVSATITGDVDTSNNSATKTVRGLLSSPMGGLFMDYTHDSCMDRVIMGPTVTNRSQQVLRGRAEPNSIIAILIGLVQVGTTTSDANGNFSYALTLPAGVHHIQMRYAGAAAARGAAAADIHRNWPPSGVRVKVDTALPFNPMSMCMTDSQGRSLALPAFGLGFTYQKIESLKPGFYTITVQANGNVNTRYDVTLGDINVSLTDPDGNGTFSGSLTVDALPVARSEASATARRRLVLTSSNGGTESSFSQSVDVTNDGVVADRVTGQPLANAIVTLLSGQSADEGGLIFGAPTTAEAGQLNPQRTGADGGYSFSENGGLHRIAVARSGYQPYRSRDIDAGADSLNKNIALTPLINGGASQVVYITANGFEPAVVNVYAGAVIEFVNIDVDEHSATGSQFDSGLLAPGASYKVRMSISGSFSYGDGDASSAAGTIAVAPGSRVLMPLVRR